MTDTSPRLPLTASFDPGARRPVGNPDGPRRDVPDVVARSGGVAGEDPERLLAKFALLDQFYARPERSAGSLTEVAASAVTAIGAATCASVSLWHHGTVRVEVATDRLAGQLEHVQRRLNQGPTLDVLIGGRSHSALLPGVTETRNARPRTNLTRQIHDLGIDAVLSMRVTTGLPDTRATLTVASAAGRTFNEDDFMDALTVARNAQGAVGAHQVMHLTRALHTSRDLGVAIGILMSRYSLTREGAVRLLKGTSQDRNRKMNALALQIIDIGELPEN